MAEKPTNQQLPRVIDPNLHLPRPPFWLIALLLVGVVLTWVPLVMVARSRVTTSPQTKIHLFMDMDNQPRLNAQATSSLFRDGRAMRPPVAGTVAWGSDASAPSDDALGADDHYYRGYQLSRIEGGGWQTQWYQSIPPRIEVDENFLKRGQQQFNTYCYPCHGQAGYGNGPINQRALELVDGQNTIWTPALDLHTKSTDGTLRFGPELYPDGQLYNTIANGIRNMPGYRTQIEVKDRWAIVAYVRALQLSQDAPLEALPPQQRNKLR